MARLDRAPAASETSALVERGGVADVAAAVLAEKVQSIAANDADLDLTARISAVAARVAALKAALAERNAELAARDAELAERDAELAERGSQLQASQAIAHQAQVREALSRSELTLALCEALATRAEAQARQHLEAAERYFETHAPIPGPRRPGPLGRRLDHLLLRLGSAGQALVIERSGLWRGAGDRLHDLRHMAAYARRGGDPGLVPPTLLDQAWYLAEYPDVARTRRSPLVHYIAAGGAEGRSPHPLFDARYYRDQNGADLDASRLSPLAHFVRVGAARGRDPHPLFDIGHYVGQQPDLEAGEDPLSHYLRIGWRVGFSPHPLFDPDWYRGQLQGHADAEPLSHYVTGGWSRGLTPHPLFDPAWYLSRYPDIAAAGIEPLAHFVLYGAREGRSPSAWFDLPHYVATRGADLAADANPLVDYLQGGAWRIGEAKPGFATAAYLAAAPDLVREGLTPLEHWARRSAG